MASNNFSGLNVSTQQGQGAANVINWQNTDKAVNQLQQEQKQREAMGYRDYVAMQQQLQKEFANVRSADIPDLMQSYGRYKSIRQQMLFNPRVRNNPEEYARMEQQANQALSDTYTGISASKGQKDFHHSLSQELLQHRDDYADDAQQVLSQDLTKTTAQLIQEGKNTVNPYLYNGSNTDFGKYLKDAQGEPTQTTGAPSQLSKDGLQFVDNAYKHGNNPAQIASTLSQNFAKHQVGKDAGWSYRHLPDDEKIKTQQDFDNLGQDYWDKWGVKKETQNLQQGNGISDAQKYAIYLSQKGALETTPQLGEPKYRNIPPDPNLQKDLELRNQKIMEGIRQGGRKELLSLREHYKKLNKQEQGELLDGLYNDLIDRAKKNPKEYTENGVKTTQYDVSANQHILNMYKSYNDKGKPIYPDRIHLRENGDVQVIYFKRDNKTGKKIITKGSNAVVDTEQSTVTPASQFKIMYGKSLLGQTETNKEANGNDDDGSGEEYDSEIKISAPASSNKWDKYKVHK